MIKTRHGEQGERKPRRNRGARRLAALLDDPVLRRRFDRVREIGARVRSSEYHLTNACNIRCRGCWFFEFDFDRKTQEVVGVDRWNAFAAEQASRGVNAALLIGGEPSLYPDRISAFVQRMPYVTISSNGLRALPTDGFENVAVALTLFGGAEADDDLRAIRPDGRRFSGLFNKMLVNYKADARATFIYAITEDSIDEIEETVSRIADNGNAVSFNYYLDYSNQPTVNESQRKRLLEEALRVAQRFPGSVLSHPYYIEALISGRSHWGEFGYDVCPSISESHSAHSSRTKDGGAPTLPGFNVFAADTETVEFCCTSGHCETCRDSQAIHSWLLVNARKFLRIDGGLRTWVEIAESYWSQFVWSDLHRSNAPR